MVNHQETPEKRLENLRSFLAAELKEDDPAQQYVADLKQSIKTLERQLKQAPFIAVS